MKCNHTCWLHPKSHKGSNEKEQFPQLCRSWFLDCACFLWTWPLWEYFSITVIPQYLWREAGKLRGEEAGSRTPLHLSQIAKHTDAQAPYIKWCSILGPPYLPISHLLIQLWIEFFTFSWLNPRMCNQRRFNLGIGGQTVFGNSYTFILKLQLEVRMWKLRHLGLGNEILLLPHFQHNLKFNHRWCLLFASFADVICISETLTWT